MKRIGLPTILFALSLLALLGYQLKWLFDRYETEQRMLTDNVVNSLKMADYSELMSRMEVLKQQEIRGQISASIGYDGQEKEVRQVTVNYNDSVKPKLNLRMDAGKRGALKSLADYQTFGAMTYQSMHAGLDQIMSIRFAMLDSLLRVSLRSYDLTMDYRLSIVRMDTTGLVDSVLISNKAGRKIVLPRLTLSNHTPIKVSPDGLIYCYPFEFTNTYAFCLQLPSVQPLILSRMAGIIGLSLFTLLIVLLVTVSLIHIIRRKDRLQEMQRNFVHNITHELRTPLSIAVTANEALNDDAHPLAPDEQSRYRTILQDRLVDLDRLIDGILRFDARRQQPIVGTSDVGGVVRRAVDLLAIRTPSTASIRVEIPSDLCAQIPESDLLRVLLHLLDNAIKYSDDPIEILVRAEVKKRSVFIAVSDRGIGIARGDIPHIFDRFYRVSTGDVLRVRGYGLGLSDVRECIESYGGKIVCKSVLGKGSSFVVRLPKEK